MSPRASGNVEETTKLATVPMWINGGPAAPNSTRLGDITNPATGQVTRKVPLANAHDIDAAVKAAEGAVASWRSTTPLRRARLIARFRELLQQNQDGLARII